jgi:molybdopterin synthase catalytic subunit
MSWQVRIQTEDFDQSREVAALRAGDLEIGGLVTFVGTVRDTAPAGSASSLQALELEHYPGMTERAIEQMMAQARQRFELRAATVIHRVGRLLPGEQIVLVAVAARHRHAAFQGCEFLMDWLKTDAPFWKKEHTAEHAASGGRWVSARQSDDEALARWGVRSGNAGAGPQQA